MTKNRTLTLVLATAASLFAQGAFAEDLCVDVTAKKTVDEARAAVVAAGFADISKMDEEHGCYEAKGMNADGTKFEVYVHPTTLAIVKVKTED